MSLNEIEKKNYTKQKKICKTFSKSYFHFRKKHGNKQLTDKKIAHTQIQSQQHKPKTKIVHVTTNYGH